MTSASLYVYMFYISFRGGRSETAHEKCKQINTFNKGDIDTNILEAIILAFIKDVLC